MLADSNALDLQNYSYALVTNALEYLGVTTCVPEPSSLSLAVMALVGAAGAVLMRRRVG
jgi:MYXO-CTERM domain-containing protein